MPEVRADIRDKVLVGPTGKPRPSIEAFLETYPQAFVNVDHVMNATAEEIAANTVDCHNCPVSIPCNGGAEEGDIMQCCGMVGYRVDPPGSPPDQTSAWLYIDCGKHRFARGGNHEVPKDQCEGCNESDGVMADDAINYETELKVGFLFTKHSVIPSNHRLKVFGQQRRRWGEIDVEIKKEDARRSQEKR